jgi:hypothetical protein
MASSQKKYLTAQIHCVAIAQIAAKTCNHEETAKNHACAQAVTCTGERQKYP